MAINPTLLAANRILNMLKKHTRSQASQIIGFVNSEFDNLKFAEPKPDPNQPALDFIETGDPGQRLKASAR